MPEESAEYGFDGQKTIRKKDKEEQAVERPNDDDPEYLAQIMQQQQQHITTLLREHTHHLEEALEGLMEKKEKCHNFDSKRWRTRSVRSKRQDRTVCKCIDRGISSPGQHQGNLR